MDEKEREFAKHYANTSCSVLHVGWAMDAYWGEVTQNIILPSCLAIHEALVKQKKAAKNKIDFNDADDTVYYIPVKDKKKKVFVHTTQSRDFLYIIDETHRYDFEAKKSVPAHNLHIRRIYRDIREDSYTVKELMDKPSIKKMLQYADTLEEHHDDHYRYSHRPSLNAYKKVGFQVPYHPKDREKERDFYGDARDGGYVLSYDGWQAGAVGPRVEHSVISFGDLNVISTIYLSCIADELGITVPQFGE